MEIKVSKLVPGCILTKDVLGKTNFPIMRKDTVLTEEHISILKKFIINKVEISTVLANGKEFSRNVVTESLAHEQQIDTNAKLRLSFYEHYKHAVILFKDHFSQWQNNIPINIPEIRQFILPLIEFTDDIGIEVYKLHQYATKEDYFYHHSISLSILSSFLARKMGFEKGESIQIGLAGFLSNVGMAKVNPNILTKDSPLTHIEQAEMKQHPSHSYLLVQSVQTITEAAKLAVLQHHERLDGSGYPLGLSGENIHKYARIIAVCETYHAMTSNRLYKKSQSPFKVMTEMNKGRYSKLDSQAMQVFIQRFINLSLGERVKLSNGQVGKITFIEKEKLISPIILLKETEEIISLEDNPSLSIIDFI